MHMLELLGRQLLAPKDVFRFLCNMYRGKRKAWWLSYEFKDNRKIKEKKPREVTASSFRL